MAFRKSSCTVRFQRSPHGPAAVLMWNGRAINSVNYPKHHKITVSEARRARRMLMVGCDELVAAERRARRRGDLSGIFDFLKPKPKKRNPMSRRIYMIRTKRGTYIPASSMHGSRRRRRRRR